MCERGKGGVPQENISALDGGMGEGIWLVFCWYIGINYCFVQVQNKMRYSTIVHMFEKSVK